VLLLSKWTNICLNKLTLLQSECPMVPCVSLYDGTRRRKLLLSKQDLLTQSICHIHIGGTIWDCRVFTSISGPLMGTCPPPSPHLQYPPTPTPHFLSLGNHSESYYGNQCEIYRTEANGCLPCVRVTRAGSQQAELHPRYITSFRFRFVTQHSEMMAIKDIERT
jgi:hypothetical protein